MHFGATLSQTAHLKLQMSCSRRSSLSFSFLPSSGNYFASHFFMGGEKFDTPHPEGYLFGENMDLNFLGNRPVQVRTDRQTLSPGIFFFFFLALHIMLSFSAYPAVLCTSFHTWHLRLTSLWKPWGAWSTLERILCDWSGKCCQK